MKMANFTSESMLIMVSLLFFMTIIKQSSPARMLGNPTPTHHRHKHHKKISFLMQNALNVTRTHPSPKTATTKFTSQIPFPKPLGFFPPTGGIPLPQSSSATQTLDVSNIGLSFPAQATLQELEIGSAIQIDEELFEDTTYGSFIVGKAQGLFVANSEDGTSHMMAMTASFGGNGFKDGLRFFGVHKKDAPESHIAVIGGTGKYHGANGYAVIKAVDLREENRTNRVLLFNVYLS